MLYVKNNHMDFKNTNDLLKISNDKIGGNYTYEEINSVCTVWK